MEQDLIEKLQPFVEQCRAAGFQLVIVEDGACSHAHSNTFIVYSFFSILKILWPGNSLDLNAIEPC